MLQTSLERLFGGGWGWEESLIFKKNKPTVSLQTLLS